MISIYSDKLAHIQVDFNCRYFMAQTCTSEGGLAYISGTLSTDDVMSYNLLKTLCYFSLMINFKHASKLTSFFYLQMGYPVVKVERSYDEQPDLVSISQERFLLTKDDNIRDDHLYRYESKLPI